MQQDFNLPQGIYLLSHSVGCLAKQAETQLTESYLSSWKLSGGEAKDYCPQNNISSGLTKYFLITHEAQPFLEGDMA
jgi:hypothetical protein